MTAGRPSEYSPSYIPNLLQQASEGKTIAEFAAGIGKAKKTIYNWAKVEPEWQEALDLAHTMWEAWMDRQGRKALQGIIVYDESGNERRIVYPINTAIYIFLRKTKLHEKENFDGADLKETNAELLTKIKEMLPD